MSEAEKPIINSPYAEPRVHWKIHEHEPAERIEGRRMAAYMYLPSGKVHDVESERETGYELELQLVTRLRKAVAEWRELALRGEGGVSRVTMELLRYWRREGREQRLFFAQLEAAETIIFLTEARKDLLQGMDIPLDEPGEEKAREGFKAFERRCCRMATGSGKTTVMAMLAAWSILNKVNNRRDRRYSDAVLVVCPNVTIRDRLAELDPRRGAASIYRTRDLVPRAMMAQLAQGRLLTTNWHVFEPHNAQSGGRVVKAGRRILVRETITLGSRNDTVRGRRYMTEGSLRKQQALGQIKILSEQRDGRGSLKKVETETERYIETDAAVVRRVLHRDLGTSRNILVFNDEAHHAYRLQGGDGGDSSMIDEEVADYYYKEATVWVDGLDRVHKLRHINICVDFSATPYFLGKAGKNTNRIFPWTVSSFDLQDAIEAGLVKIPQMAVRDSSGAPVPGYFNIWRWILPKLSAAERGGKKTGAKPEAILKHAHPPIAMLGGMWEQKRKELAETADRRPPVFIIVCKTRKLAKVVYDWLAAGRSPTPTIPDAQMRELRNTEDRQNTILVYSDVQKDLDSGNAKGDESRWMRHSLDTVGREHWPTDGQGREQYPEGFAELADKLGRGRHPPGRDVRCIVSVGMLTEGWDCNTVTHIIGLRPFQSQLLCEQVVGRGLRRASYEVDENGLMSEEIATVFGVPLSAFTVKAAGGKPPPRVKTHRIHALPQRAHLEISFPRVEGYCQAVRNRITCDIENVAGLVIDDRKIPTDVEMKAGLRNNRGRLSLHGPGRASIADMQAFVEEKRLQERIWEMTAALTRDYLDRPECTLPRNAAFAQLLRIVGDYMDQKVVAEHPSTDKRLAFLSPWYGYIIERLLQGIIPDECAGERPELPRYEAMRGPGSTADVDFRTRREPCPVTKSHLNALVPDTKRLEQSVGYMLDHSDAVQAFVKNEGMGFAIPYMHDGQMHEYRPDFIVRLQDGEQLILEPKGYDELAAVKKAAAERWVNAVNASALHGRWRYAMVKGTGEARAALQTP